MKNIFKFFLSISLMISIVPVRAIEANSNGLLYYPHLDGVGNIESGPDIIINGKVNHTYLQFKNVNEALNDLEDCTDIISHLKEKYNLKNLSDENWEMYNQALYKELYIDCTYEMSNEEVVMIQECFDVCDNNKLNQQILSVYNDGNYEIDELAILMPYTQPIYNEFMENRNNENTTRAVTFNTTNAVNYASQYAESLNGNYKYYLGSDCTNFASQIARAAGITPQGNWYYISSSDVGTAWIRADTFVKFWGVDYSTASFSNLSNHVYKGAFIAFDKNSDGKYDHVGFVTAVTSNTKTTEGVTYKDFKIAQHSNDYHLWVSDSRNGWESVGGLKVIIEQPRLLGE